MLKLRVQAETADMSQLEETIQKWQRTAHKAQRHADACHAEANAKDEEAAEATAQVVLTQFFVNLNIHAQLCQVSHYPLAADTSQSDCGGMNILPHCRVHSARHSSF